MRDVIYSRHDTCTERDTKEQVIIGARRETTDDTDIVKYGSKSESESDAWTVEFNKPKTRYKLEW